MAKRIASKKRTPPASPIAGAKAAYLALNAVDRFEFCAWLMGEDSYAGRVVADQTRQLLELKQALEAAKSRKPDIEAYKEILKLRETMSYGKLAKHYKVPQATVISRVRQAEAWQKSCCNVRLL